MLLTSLPFILHNAMRSVRWAFIIMLQNSTAHHHQLNRTPPTSASVGNHLPLWGGWLLRSVAIYLLWNVGYPFHISRGPF